MGYVFTQAPSFNVLQDVTAASHSLLAEAFNSRLRSGLGDGTRRIHQYALALTRQIRNPTADNTLWPPVGEFSEMYAHLDYDASPDTIAPGKERGDWEGPNLGAPINAFIFGNQDVMGEGDRLSDYMVNVSSTEDTAETIWNNAKQMRGGYNPITQESNAPMFTAAQQHMAIVQPKWSFMGKSYGGYMPQWMNTGWCYHENYGYWASFSPKFRNLDTGEEIIYPGSCGPLYGGSTGDVQYIADLPFAYYVYTYAYVPGQGYTDAPTVSALTRFPKSDWLAIKDGGGFLERPNGDGIQRLMLQSFLKDFRGTEEQRTSACYDVREVAFSFEEFLTRQYQLAPAYATTTGTTLNINYPGIVWNGHNTLVAGSVHPTKIQLHDGFTIGGRLYIAEKLRFPATIQTLVDGVQVDEFEIQPGDTQDIATYSGTYDGAEISFRLGTDVVFTEDAGQIQIEISELYCYKPELWDAYCYIRMSSAKGALAEGEMDQRGIDFSDSKTIYDNYNHYGTVIGNTEMEQQIENWNNNPVFDAARRTIQNYTRVLNRRQLTAYEVDQDGNSILYFMRHIFNADNDLDWDAFRGILNEDTPEENCIEILAPTGSWTNEWVLDINTKTYGGEYGNESNTSEYKPSVYADYFPYIQRCHFMNPRITGLRNPDMFVHFQQSPFVGFIDIAYRGMLMAPEALSAYNYAQRSNDGMYMSEEQMINFYKSCQIYPEPYNISSITGYTEGDVEYVKVVLDGRLQHTETAPAIVQKDVTAWDEAALHAEEYRTDENAIREYLLLITDSNKNGTHKIGDCASSFNYQYDGASGNPHGAIFPCFYFTKLVPKPFDSIPPAGPMNAEDTGTYNTDNTIITADLPIMCETYLRAMCEGYVDEKTALYCDGIYDNAYDYSFENLCYDAFGGRWISNTNSTARPDYPQSYGPLPNMQVYAECLDQISKCVNKLTKVRLCIPWKLMTKQYNYQSDIRFDEATIGDYCDGGTSYQMASIILNHSAPSPGNLLTYDTEWNEEPTYGMVSRASFGWAGSMDVTNDACEDIKFGIQTNKTTMAYSFTLVDPNSHWALSDDLLELFSYGTNGFFGTTTRIENSAIVEETTDENEICQTCAHTDAYGNLVFSTMYWDNDKQSGFKCTPIAETTNLGCLFYTAGVIDVGAPPETDSILCKGPPSEGTTPTTGRGGSDAALQVDVTNTDTMVIIVPTI